MDRQTLTPQQIKHLGLRLAPCYFRVPDNAYHIAEQIFGSVSYKRAQAEREANFDSWAIESQISRIEGRPGVVKWDGKVVRKYALPGLFRKKKREDMKKKKENQRLQTEEA